MPTNDPPQERKITLAESLTGNEPSDDPQPSRGEGLSLFPLIADRIFPIQIGDMLIGVKHINIDFLNKIGNTTLSRIIVKSGRDTVQIRWTNGTKNGKMDVRSNEMVEHRGYRLDRTQYCLFGSGATLFYDSDPIVFHMEDKARLSLEEWLILKENGNV